MDTVIDKSVLQTISEMMSERKYSLFSTNRENIELVYCKDEKKNNETKEKEINKDSIIVFFPQEKKVNIDIVKEKIYKMKNNNIKKCIIVYKETITSSAKKTLELLNSDIELFIEDELKYNITKHYLVPKHILLPDNEKRKLKEKFGKKMPVLLKSDPVSRFYNYKKRDIIKIIRDNDIVCYRVVV
jgi:DNA-directed RNA polymerase I, II, and III subunit RPABC1